MTLQRRLSELDRVNRSRRLFPLSKKNAHHPVTNKKKTGLCPNFFLQESVEDHINKLHDVIEENLIKIPVRFDSSQPPFIYFSYLMVIYEESYDCIIYGHYHSGILLLGQLLEFTTMEILRIHTGKTKPTFDQALHLLAGEHQSKKTKQWIPGGPAIVDPFFLKLITTLKNEIRNPYTHGDFRKIFNNKTTPVINFKIGSDPKKIVERVGKAIKTFEKPEFEPEQISLAIDPVIATLYKPSHDKKRVFDLAFTVYVLFWDLLDAYLKEEDIKKFINEHGSPLAEIPTTDIDDQPDVKGETT